MKRRLLFVSVLVVALLVSGCGLSVWQAKRQYTLNRQLVAALLNNDNKQAIALVNAGADPNTPYATPPAPSFKRLLNQLLHRSSPPPHNDLWAFLFVCGEGWELDNGVFADHRTEDVYLVQSMLEYGADCKGVDSENHSALSWAALRSRIHLTQLLLEHGANVNQQDTSGNTPLMYAVRHFDVNMTRLLLEHGADVSLKNKWEVTALYDVVSECRHPHNHHNTDILHLLLAHGANPNQPSVDNGTPLWLAQSRGEADIVTLLQKGAKQHKGRSGRSRRAQDGADDG